MLTETLNVQILLLMTDNLMNILGGAIIGIALVLGFSNAFLESHKKVAEWEGGYVNHPLDRGKETNYGITRALADKYGYTGEMKDLPYETALQIFHEEYWVKHNIEPLASVNQKVAEIVYDQLILHGKTRGIEWLQWCANVTDNFTQESEEGKTIVLSMLPSISVDGEIGDGTLEKIQLLIREDKIDRLHDCQRAKQIRFMLGIVIEKPDQRVFLAGWLKRAFQSQNNQISSQLIQFSYFTIIIIIICLLFSIHIKNTYKSSNLHHTQLTQFSPKN